MIPHFESYLLNS